MEIDNIKKIYNMLADDISREIFINKINYYITSNNLYLYKFIDKYVKKNREFSWSAFIGKDNIYIYGAGGVGQALYYNLKSMKIKTVAFVDRNNDRLNSFEEIDVISPNDFFDIYKNKKTFIAIGSEMYFQEIYDYLIENGVKETDILGGGCRLGKTIFRY